MKEKIRSILKKLNKGEITTNEALDQIKNVHENLKLPKRKASKIKIYITDEDKNIKLPAIPFWLLDLFISLGLGLGSIALKFVNDIDEETKSILESINSEDLRKIFNELKKYGPFDMVDIEDGDNTIVKISIL
ncbi:hypothetical protein EDD65_10717 [Keratinibaculum paraultunense]|uniref:Uncharacterized protein n=1 Tax=Keratinibaculum paraultunense TaxID=1278232 RepID=A0A4R3KTK6_9FIRM|nr:hypothetical protein [Keratinibaculum paraultunense]QQY79787.1 hypothetical protein JL105_00150 [Keratinibaculum paraultunense]TCS88667.1 hypothetical protein EDD65_10717 [Keratinibaculum paraultunense]